jgi:ATP-dependent RNA helicase DDX19/DBP5
MCPTRELVVQNLEVLRKMAKYTKITACSTADEEGGPPRRDPIRDQVGVAKGTGGVCTNLRRALRGHTINNRLLRRSLDNNCWAWSSLPG